MLRTTGSSLHENLVPSPMKQFGITERLYLRSGDWVEVKSEAEILATLDQDGKLESLPFMPEMLKYCGARFRVSNRADRTCDTIQMGRRQMQDAVHLADLRCDGDAHGGCQANCLLFWKEAWLRRADDGQAVRVGRAKAGDVAPSIAPRGEYRCTRSVLMAACRSVNEAGDGVYTCQATELRKATSALAWWHAGQYVRDIRSGNVTVLRLISAALIGAFNKLQVLLRRYLPPQLLIRGGLRYPFIGGALTKTPRAILNLAAGDLVEIKSREEIVGTLDTRDRNRGLLFDREMVGYCGRRTRVLRRVNRIIDERTGKMLEFDSDCLMLEDVYCRGDFNQGCPRAIYSFWREIWLRKVDQPVRACASVTPPGAQPAVVFSLTSATSQPPCVVTSRAPEQVP